jgi:hypothetical protein
MIKGGLLEERSIETLRILSFFRTHSMEVLSEFGQELAMGICLSDLMHFVLKKKTMMTMVTT